MSKNENLGRFVWFDLPTTDAEAAAAFYRQVLGWTTQPGPGPGYQLFVADGRPMGGVMQLSPEACRDASPAWMGHVEVDDVDTAVARAGRLGASVAMQAQDIPGTGRFAILVDPQGAGFPIFASLPGQGEACPTGSGPGFFGWSELRTPDAGRSMGFYGELFAWRQLDAFDMGASGTYTTFGPRDAAAIGGMRPIPPTDPTRPHWFHYVQVADLEQAMERIRSAGGAVDGGPWPIPGGGRMAHCRDPQGAAFGLSD